MRNQGNRLLVSFVGLIRWIFGGLLALGSLINFSQSPVANLIVAASALAMIPPISKWIVKKINNKTTEGVIASLAFVTTILAVGSTAPPSNPTQTTAQQQALTTTPSQTENISSLPSTQEATKVIAPVVVPSAPKISPKVSDTANTNTSLARDINCKVVGITDGDTINCLTKDKNQIKVRLNQIDAPEKNQAFGTAARQALSGYVFGKMVGLKTNGTDKYGRTIAEVFVGDRNINKAMVADGYAWAYREYMSDNEYASLETRARSDTKGLWSEPDPIYPSDFRRGKRGEQTAPVQTQMITQQVEQQAAADSGGSCGSKRYCKQMATCAEARHYLNDCGVSRLDRDGDGVPCESICN